MSQIKIEQLTESQKQQMKIPSQPVNNNDWSVWTCDPSVFDWHYDQMEMAYVYEGKVRVKTPDGQVEINAGDFVTFPQGLSCTWEVMEKIKKVYCFK